MTKRKLYALPLIIISVLLTAPKTSGQTQLSVSSLAVPTKVSPGYFGPNAFPVPDMSDGRTSPDFKVEMYSDNHFGTMTGNGLEDFTSSLFLRLSIPLFTPRVNLVLWGGVLEYYNVSEQTNDLRRVAKGKPLHQTIGGDIYVSTDIMVFTQEKNYVDLTIRAALKSASGGNFEEARYYDCPGYFFDAAIGRDFHFGEKNIIRTSLSTGFLCWQTDNGRQNDAVMYGIRVAYSRGPFSISSDFGGYAGWENDGDCPMTIKTRVSWTLKPVTFVAGYQYGFIDWPFHQARLGVSVAISKLKLAKRK